MQRGTQLDYLGTERYRLFVPVHCPVIQRHLYPHPPPHRPTPEISDPQAFGNKDREPAKRLVDAGA